MQEITRTASESMITPHRSGDGFRAQALALKIAQRIGRELPQKERRQRGAEAP